MTVSVGDTLEDAVERMVTVPGLFVLVLFLAFRLANPAVYRTFFARGAEFALRETGGYTLRDVEMELIERGYADLLPLLDVVRQSGMDVSFPVAVALLAALPFIAELLHVVGVRAFAARDPNSVPVSDITSGLVGAYVKSLIANAIALVLIVLATPFFLIPGIALTILFFFVRHRIVLAGDGIFEAISESYALVVENAVPMVVLGVVFWLTWAVVTFVVPMVPLGDLSGAAGRVAGTVVVVFGISMLTSAYLQAVGGGGDAAATPAGQSDALGA
ncbi:hypothetical protein [Halosimplex pelagicum]|uniref:Uncharacterized protein n=1 Tax=Halosimplex pelagicum TaxID=869886 RepID=A0A7D5T5A2_9EURY|nr:hypothetical protein [Halosimplex pelagicum]QLH83271.1 hypothetical protein HZS54_17250 [Halosimplex pelagicum]